jgi:hypothetical protein
MSGFGDAELRVLNDCYSDVDGAARLLRRTDFPRHRIPVAKDAYSFWFEVNSELAKGILADGREQILAVAREEYPHAFEPVSKKSRGGAQGSRCAQSS